MRARTHKINGGTMRYPHNYRQSMPPESLAALPPFCTYVGYAPDLQHLKGLVLETATVEQVVYIGERNNIQVELPPDGAPTCPWKHVAIEELDGNGHVVVSGWTNAEPIPTFKPDAMSRADLGKLGWTDALLADKAKELFGEEYESDSPGLSDMRRTMFDRVMKTTFG